MTETPRARVEKPTKTKGKGAGSEDNLFGLLSVLVVDDQALMRKIVRDLLRQVGIRDVVEASDGKEALDLLVQHGGPQPDFVICDLVMETMDGTQFCQHLRRSESSYLRQLPVIVLTGLQDELLDEVALQVGAVEVVHKPISAADLRETICRAVGLDTAP